ncbi:BQ5605_C014g07659 [Microbotryum silenes-dioicae]|uniref:BQ5605_C014g07659 protein n=1 Tax=Microbotryum silenes-dioicae TaxID=796604 RepID=A0A2X0MNY6_9BASI|nr:BQ5605_C014g07659 [Microbotryum silenes-dioicae]
MTILPRLSTSTPIFSKFKPLVTGRRPIATSTTSASIVDFLPSLAPSISSETLPSFLVAPSTLVLSENLMPCLVKIFWNALAMPPSIPAPPMPPKNSTTSTLAPNRDQTEPISKPMTPAPMTTNFSGTFCRSRTPVDETICFSSISIPGKGVTSDPVAIMTFLAETWVFPPSRRATSISVAEANEASPLM